MQQCFWSIINCKFEFQCNQQWKDMSKTPFSNVRFCDQCQKEVYMCKTQKQADWLSLKGLCGAVPMGYDDLLIGLMVITDEHIKR